MYRRIILLALLFVAVKLNGQIENSFKYIDSLTYSLYSQGNWDVLIKEGNSAFKNGIDYYYLRMRVGIAYYEKHNYALSAIHLRKALDFNEKDQIALEYLFYSYYLSGQHTRAFSIMSLFYPQNRERIIKESGLKKNSMTIESYFCNPETDNIISEPADYFSDTDDGNQIVTKYFINNSISASHLLGDHASYFHSYTFLLKDNYLNYFDGTDIVRLNPQRVIQNQYYGSFKIFSASGFSVSPSFHLLKASYPLVTVTSTGMNSRASKYSVAMKGFFTGISLAQSVGFADVSIATGYSEINYLKQAQGTFSLMVYPSGNLNIYFGGKVSLAKELNGSSLDMKITQSGTLGFSLARKVWLEFSALTGDLKNYIGNNGLYIYNSADILKNRFYGRLIFPIVKTGLTISAGGGISAYYSELAAEDGSVVQNSNNINYNSINFTGGISWNF